MDAQDMRIFSTVCTSLEEKFRQFAETEEAEMPFDPIEVADALSAAVKDFRTGPSIVRSN